MLPIDRPNDDPFAPSPQGAGAMSLAQNGKRPQRITSRLCWRIEPEEIEEAGGAEHDGEHGMGRSSRDGN